MVFYLVECKDNGFVYESKSLIKICEMFDLKYKSTYDNIRNSLYNQRGLYKHRHKQKLNAWINMGNSLMDGLKKSFTDAEVDILDGMTDVYHEQSDSIRKQIKESK